MFFFCVTQVHQSEIDALAREGALARVRASEDMERLRDDLEGKYRSNLSELSLEQKQKLSRLQASHEQQLHEMESRLQREAEEHARKIEELQERHVLAEREAKEKAEEAVRYALGLSSCMESHNIEHTITGCCIKGINYIP